MPIDLTLLAGGTIGAGFVYLVLREYWRNKRTQEQRKVYAQKNQPVDINQMIDAAKDAYEEAMEIYAEQKKAGASAEQLAPLEQRIKKLKWVVDNEFLVRIGAPYADQVAKIVFRWLK